VKARITYSALESNSGKLRKLDELHAEYCSYVQTCIDLMVSDKRPKVLPSERRKYFSTSEVLSSQILKNAQMHAVQVIETWIKGLYGRKLKKHIGRQTELSDLQRMELYCVGKYLIRNAGKFGKGTISQEMVDLYWSWVWDQEITGKTPEISDDFPMILTEMTCTFGPSNKTTSFCWWLSTSCLEKHKTVKIPLAYNPYLKGKASLAKSVMARKANGRWSFQFCEKTLEEKFDGTQGKIGVDVGLNVIASTSDGRLYGSRFKPKFNRLYKKVQSVRANRQRQGMQEDSKRLARLEARLSGLTKTATGTVSNQLVKDFPGHTFVIEDLDLRGCRGQKRFAYRALHHSLSTKTAIEVVNPAYTSQICPSCGHISRSNRSGTSFTCRCCGRKSHADVVGAINLLGRSEDKQINRCENPSDVRTLLGERYLRKRSSSLGRFKIMEPKPNGPKLTTRASSRKRQTGTASNQVGAKTKVLAAS
jgi:hypothetical protein